MSANSAPEPARGERLLSRDGRRLFLTRLARLFAYGFVSVVLVLYLVSAGLSEARVGLLLTLTLLGDTAISLALTTSADAFGRRRTLIVGAGLMLLAGAVFAVTGNFLLLLAAATVGVISPSGNEVGPLLASPALMGVPFFLAGGLKIVYDLLLWQSFRHVGEEARPETGRAQPLR